MSRKLMILSVFLGVGICLLAYAHLVPTRIDNTGASYVYYYSLEDMEEASDVIAIVRVTDNEREVRIDSPNPGEKYMYRGHTPLEIIEVFKGDVEPGQTIEVLRGYEYERRVTGLYVYENEYFRRATKDQTYLVFLVYDNGKEHDGFYEGYWFAAVFQGKMVWPKPDELTSQTLELRKMDPVYLEMYQEAMEKYGR